MGYIQLDITNGDTNPVPVKLTGSGSGSMPVDPSFNNIFGADYFYIDRKGNVAGGANEQLFITTRPAQIEWLEFATNSVSLPRLQIEARSAAGSYTPVGFLGSDGVNIAQLSMGNIASNGVSIFDIKVYDTTANTYKIAFNRPIRFPRGFLLRLIRDTSSITGINAAVRAYGMTY